MPALAVKSTIPAHEEHTASCQKVSDCPLTLSEPVPKKGLSVVVCKIPLLARRTRPSARATIGYLVYNVSRGSGIKTDQHRCDQNYFFVYNLLYIVSAFHKNMKK